MDNWKQAFWLVKFELRQYEARFLLLIPILIFALFLIVTTIPDYLEYGNAGTDALFIIFIGTAGQWIRPKGFLRQKVHSDLWAAPYLIMLNQLPITKKTIIKYRALIHVLFSILFNLLLLVFIYILTPDLQDMMTTNEYFIFAIIWICFGMYSSYFHLIFDAGMNLILLIIAFICIIVPLIFAFNSWIFNNLDLNGLVHWTIWLATVHPVITLITLLFLVVAGWYYCKKIMRKKMDTIDYL